MNSIYPSIRFLAVFIISGMVCTSAAQVTIDESDMPVAGDLFYFTTTSGLPDGVDPSIAGEGMIWDFSGISPQFNDIDTFLAVIQTPFPYQFFFNNQFFYPNHKADYAKKEMDLDLGLVSITNSFSYFKSDEQGLRNVGFGANVNGIPSSVRNLPIDWVYEFPLQYEDVSSSYSESEIEIPGLGYYHRTQDRLVEVEGWGTVILPDSSYEVLKVKMILNGLDSIYIDAFETGFSFPRPEETVYQWISPGEIEPVLQVSQQSGFGAVVRYKYSAPSSLPEARQMNINVYPNPANDFINVRRGQEPLNSFAIYDASGREVIRKRTNEVLQEEEIPVHSFSPGEYFMLLDVGGVSYYTSFFKN